MRFPPVLLLPCLLATANGEIIGIEPFDYADGSIATRNGGKFWDYKNTTPTGHTGTASAWASQAGNPVVTGGKLVTADTQAIRRYNGSNETEGAINDANVAKAVYYRITVTTGAGVPGYMVLSSYDFGNEQIYFGKPFGSSTFGIGTGSGPDTTTGPTVQPNTTYTLVAELDHTADVVSLFVNPDLHAAEPSPTVTRAYTNTNWSTAIRVGSGIGGNTVAWDDLVVATTWADLGNVVVTTATDEDNGTLGGGTGISLREAVNHAASGARITFAPVLDGKVFALTAGELVVPSGRRLTIDASALASGITLDANDNSRLFFVDAGRTLTLRGLNLMGGNAAGATPSGRGGAIMNLEGNLVVDRCTLTGNQATRGGAIYSNTDLTTSSTVLTHCTLTGNQATITGSAVHNEDGLTSVTACTISGNSGPSGAGGLASFGDTATGTMVDRSVISGNIGGDVQVAVIFDHNSFTSLGHNLIGFGNATGDFTVTGDQTSVTDPKLSPLGYFGGPVMTMHPLIGSPAIDSAGTIDPGGTDARGFPRFVDGNDSASIQLDIGAVEAGPVYRLDSATDLNLRQLINIAGNASTPGVRVRFNFASAITITLSAGQLAAAAGKSLFLDASDVPGGVTLSGNTVSRVFSIPATATVAMHNLTLTQGRTADKTGTTPSEDGGGILSLGKLSLFSCNVTGNRTGNTEVYRTPAGAGGGICSRGPALVVKDCVISGNVTGSETDGGEGQAPGGGIFSADGIALIHSCRITGNTSAQYNGQGGGICNGSTLKMSHCLVSENRATIFQSSFGGGGVSSSGPFEMKFCTVASNRAGYGGGLNVAGDRSRIYHSTIAGNSTHFWGGGIDGGGLLSHCTVADNRSEERAALRGTFTFMNSVVTGTASGIGFERDIDVESTIISQGVNYVGKLSGPVSVTGPPLIVADAKLAPLGDYGGTLPTCIPLPGSPLIDAATTSPEVIDQRGFPRTGLRDIGAVEFQGTTEYPRIWNFDPDGDGNNIGVEFALGTNPAVSDPGHANNLRITRNGSGQPVFDFGRNSAANSNIIWRVTRSTTLLPGSFTEIFRYTSGAPAHTGTTSVVTANSFQVTDTNPSAGGKAFYRFEAVSP